MRNTVRFIGRTLLKLGELVEPFLKGGTERLLLSVKLVQLAIFPLLTVIFKVCSGAISPRMWHDALVGEFLDSRAQWAEKNRR